MYSPIHHFTNPALNNQIQVRCPWGPATRRITISCQGLAWHFFRAIARQKSASGRAKTRFRHPLIGVDAVRSWSPTSTCQQPAERKIENIIRLDILAFIPRTMTKRPWQYRNKSPDFHTLNNSYQTASTQVSLRLGTGLNTEAMTFLPPGCQTRSWPI